MPTGSGFQVAETCGAGTEPARLGELRSPFVAGGRDSPVCCAASEDALGLPPPTLSILLLSGLLWVDPFSVPPVPPLFWTGVEVTRLLAGVGFAGLGAVEDVVGMGREVMFEMLTEGIEVAALAEPAAGAGSAGNATAAPRSSCLLGSSLTAAGLVEVPVFFGRLGATTTRRSASVMLSDVITMGTSPN